VERKESTKKEGGRKRRGRKGSRKKIKEKKKISWNEVNVVCMEQKRLKAK
jgi:hypothetical protein